MSFEFHVRAYYEDTDTGGIVFYANYLKFFERARTEWLRSGGRDATGAPHGASSGFSQQRIADELGLMFVVRSTRVDYRRPARLDDVLRIVSTTARVGRVGIDFHQEAYLVDSVAGTGGVPEPLVAIGRIQVACVTRDRLKPAQIPAELRAVFEPT